MRILLLALGAAATALAAPALAQGRGHGQGQGKDQTERGQGRGDSEGRGAGRDRDRGPDRGARAEHGRPDHAGPDHARREERRAEVRAHADRGRGAGVRAEHRRDRLLADRRRGPVERRAVVLTGRNGFVRLQRGPRWAQPGACPPGLARKFNGCLPPGQARHLAAQRLWYGGLWRGDGLLRYDDGYLWRLRPDGVVLGYMPLAGGALWVGNPWPARYAYAPVPAYFTDYYGFRDPYSYRYADGVIYGIDPETERIRLIAGLLTGDDWAIGRPMPIGYSVYNVPSPYRVSYYDTPDAWYRYSDGYVYRVDPTTQLIEAAIRLVV